MNKTRRDILKKLLSEYTGLDFDYLFPCGELYARNVMGNYVVISPDRVNLYLPPEDTRGGELGDYIDGFYLGPEA